MMINKLLIANRGEIACRIIRSARQLGIQTVAVFTNCDASALHVKLADEAHALGSPRNYLDQEKILNIAKSQGVDAIHPGYGFLSENPDFAEQCEQAGIIFVGPSPKSIRDMAHKDKAKSMMEAAGIAVIPGYHGKSTAKNKRAEKLFQEAERIGYPILIKAVAGGGGKGMRIVKERNDFASALESAQREALASFGNDEMILEKYFTHARHVEVQIFADKQGHVIHLHTRDCSLQRRHQKIIEEAIAPKLSDNLRKQLHTLAVKAAQAIHYVGAGTVEFLVANDTCYFMEMNTRLQVEHPVTEMVTGLNLVAMQLDVAAGKPLSIKQDQVKNTGHAMEVRIYAEDPQNHFLPSTGKLHYFRPPTENEHLRLDTGYCEGDTVSVHYDPLLCKLIAWGEDRAEAIEHLLGGLREFKLVGVKTNIRFLFNLLQHEAFIHFKIDTQLLDNEPTLARPVSADLTSEKLAIAALAHCLLQMDTQGPGHLEQDSPWLDKQHWRLNVNPSATITLWSGEVAYPIIMLYPEQGLHILIDQQTFIIENAHLNDNEIFFQLNRNQYTVHAFIVETQLYLFLEDEDLTFELHDPKANSSTAAEQASHLLSPMPGIITSVKVTPGETVSRGQALLTISAMKMEHTLYAPEDGEIDSIFYQQDAQVEAGVQLLSFKQS